MAVVGNIDAMCAAIELAATPREITAADVDSIHATLLAPTRDIPR